MNTFGVVPLCVLKLIIDHDLNVQKWTSFWNALTGWYKMKIQLTQVCLWCLVLDSSLRAPKWAMGPLLVLVCPCFRENVIVTCKIVSFLCSLDNFLLKNVIIFFFGNQISKWHSFEKRVIFDLGPTFHLFWSPGERHKNSFSRYLTYIHVFCSFYWLLLPYQFCKKLRIYHVWFLFGVNPGVDSFLHHFGNQ